MMAQPKDLTLGKVIAAVEGELSRRKMKNPNQIHFGNPNAAEQSPVGPSNQLSADHKTFKRKNQKKALICLW